MGEAELMDFFRTRRSSLCRPLPTLSPMSISRKRLFVSSSNTFLSCPIREHTCEVPTYVMLGLCQTLWTMVILLMMMTKRNQTNQHRGNQITESSECVCVCVCVC